LVIALAAALKVDYPSPSGCRGKPAGARKQNRVNHQQPLAELARYLESQIPGAIPALQPFPAAPPPAELISALYERQLALNDTSTSLLKRRGPTPKCVRTLAEIPALPVTAFKQLDLTTVTPAQRVTVFHSSGSTGHVPSRHYHSAATLRIYELAIEAWFKRRMLGHLAWIWERRQPAAAERHWMFSLTPSPSDAPHSSLVFMIGSLIQRFGASASCFAGRTSLDGWQLDFQRALRLLQSVPANIPVILFGTAFNFVHLTDEMARRGKTVHLPDGSQIMETGGYKGRSRTVPKAELHETISMRLGVARDRIICEYGMAELSSQAYDADLGVGAQLAERRFQFPPWCHAAVISPETGREVDFGQTGLLRIIDLANVASVLGIQTEDLAIRHADGIALKGRATQSEPRGCSLVAMEG